MELSILEQNNSLFLTAVIKHAFYEIMQDDGKAKLTFYWTTWNFEECCYTSMQNIWCVVNPVFAAWISIGSMLSLAQLFLLKNSIT